MLRYELYTVHVAAMMRYLQRGQGSGRAETEQDSKLNGADDGQTTIERLLKGTWRNGEGRYKAVEKVLKVEALHTPQHSRAAPSAISVVVNRQSAYSRFFREPPSVRKKDRRNSPC